MDLEQWATENLKINIFFPQIRHALNLFHNFAGTLFSDEFHTFTDERNVMDLFHTDKNDRFFSLLEWWNNHGESQENNTEMLSTEHPRNEHPHQLTHNVQLYSAMGYRLYIVF